MTIQAIRRIGRLLAVASAMLLGASALWASVLWASAARADVVTLKSGGIVHGSVLTPPSATGSKTLAVKTAAGTMIVFEQQVVKQVERAPRQAPVGKGKSRLAPEEEAWMRKVHTLVTHLYSSDRDQVRRARSELQRIDDPDALPALTTYLGRSSSEESRQLYVSILKSTSGTRPVDYLVEQSFADPSPKIRDESRKAIGPQRADAARALYIHVLKMRDPNLSSLAAEGIHAIGDPNGEAVPYLIDTLVFNTQRVVMTRPPQQIIPLDAAGPAFPSAKVVPGQGRGGGFTASGAYGSAWSPGIDRFTFYDPVRPPNKPHWPLAPETPEPIFTDPDLKVVVDNNGNPSVLRALTKATGKAYPGFGYKPDEWRRWWDNEKLNRDLQNRGTKSDRKISAQPR